MNTIEKIKAGREKIYPRKEILKNVFKKMDLEHREKISSRHKTFNALFKRLFQKIRIGKIISYK